MNATPPSRTAAERALGRFRAAGARPRIRPVVDRSRHHAGSARTGHPLTTGPRKHRFRTAADRRLAHVRHMSVTRRRTKVGPRRDLTTGLCVLVVLTAGAYLPSPLYPGYQQAFGFGDLAMTLIYATFALVSAPALLLFGSASDTLGPRVVLRTGIVAAAVGSACFALAAGPQWLAVGRAAQGIALGAATGAAGALISARAGRVRGGVLASIAFVAGTAAGPVASGLIAEFAPAPQLLPYAVHLALLAAAWHRVSRLEHGDTRPSRRWSPTWPRIPASIRLPFLASATTGFLAWTVAGLFLAVIPSLLERQGPSSVAITGGVLGLVLACSVLAQPFVVRLGPTTAQFVGLAALSASLGTLTLDTGGSLTSTLAAGLVAGAGHGLAYGGAATAVDRIAPDAARGAVTGALYLAFYLGAGVPAIVIGILTSWYPLATATGWVAGVAAGVVPLAAAAVLRSRQRRGAAEPDRRRQCRRRWPDASRDDHHVQAGRRHEHGRRRWLGRRCRNVR